MIKVRCKINFIFTHCLLTIIQTLNVLIHNLSHDLLRLIRGHSRNLIVSQVLLQFYPHSSGYRFATQSFCAGKIKLTVCLRLGANLQSSSKQQLLPLNHFISIEFKLNDYYIISLYSFRKLQS